MHRALLPDWLPALALGLVLGLALWHDVRTRRIPNYLIVAGSFAAFLMHALLPPGAGLFSSTPGGLGIWFSLAGWGLGLLLLLPFYALRTLGAGDVKLMAAIGAFLGPYGVMGATLLTMLCGGVLALAVAWKSGHLLQVTVNVQQMLRGLSGAGAGLAEPVVVTGKLPYAIAIACGTAAQLMLAGASEWRFFS
jgi:prepilin peptidase CpaA